MPSAASSGSPVLAALREHWFADAPAERLALMRIAIGGFAFVYHALRLDEFLIQPNPRMFAPVTPLAWMGEAPSAELMFAMYCLCMAANLAFVLGFRHAIVGPLFAATFTMITSYRSSFSMIYHSENLLVWHVIVLAFAPSADALALDAKRRKKKLLWQYGWPIKLLVAVTVALYFLAGVAKLTGELGLDWAQGEELKKQVASDAIRKYVLGNRDAAPPVLGWEATWIYTLIGVVTLIVEVGAPAAMVGPRVGMAWAVSAWLMHVGILGVMGIQFRYPLSGVALLPFFQPERLVARFRKAPS